MFFIVSFGTCVVYTLVWVFKRMKTTNVGSLTRSTLLLSLERCVPPRESLQGPYRSNICSSPWRGTHSRNYTALWPAPPNQTTHRHAHTTVSPQAPLITHLKRIDGLQLNYVYGLLK